MSGGKHCFPACKAFRCARMIPGRKSALIYHGNRAWCRWTEEECEVSNCNYTVCAKRRLLSNGICGESVKRKTTEKGPEETLGPVVKLRGKAFRKIGEKEIF